MTNDTPIGPLVEGAKRATIHFAKAVYEIATGVGALVGGVVHTVRPDDDEPDAHPPQHVPVE
jgi:hypothetical protein